MRQSLSRPLSKGPSFERSSSRTSVDTQRSSSRPSLLRRASSFLTNGSGGSRASSSSALKSRSSIFGFSSRPSAFEVDLVVAPGDLLETTAIVTVREEESLESLVVAELPTGTTLRILEIGVLDRRRVKVSMTECVGWISLKTRMGEALVARTFVADDFEVGGMHEVKSVVTLRAAEPLDSEVIIELPAGTRVKVTELGATSLRRARVAADHAEGWMSLCTKNGEYLLGKIEGSAYASRHVTNVSAALLEAARSGDLEGFTKLAEGDGGGSRSSFLGKPAPARPDLNATDIRGKSALMFAASWGHARIVAYLLSQPEVDIFQADDTMKQALHHASRMPRGAPCEAHGIIIEALLKAGANVEVGDHRGATPLMIAAGVGHGIAVKALLAGSASVDTRDREGETAIDYARRGRQDELVQLLTEHSTANVQQLSPTKSGVAVDLELQADTAADGDEVAAEAESPESSPARRKKVKKFTSRPKAEKALPDSTSPMPEGDHAEGESPAVTPISPEVDKGEEDEEGGEVETDAANAKDKAKVKKKAKSKISRKRFSKKPVAGETAAAEDSADEDEAAKVDAKVEEKHMVEEKEDIPVLTVEA